MAFREVRVYEVREVLRLWLDGEGLRSIERLSAVDRKTVRRYVSAAIELGLARDGGVGQLGDEFVAAVVEVVRPHRRDGHGHGWQRLVTEHDTVKKWVAKDLTAVRIHELLARRGVVVPLRTVQRYVRDECGRRRRGPTVRVADGEPGDELQVDFGRMGHLDVDGRRRVVWALIFTASFSRHCFVWLSHRQTIDDVIDGFEAAWVFFGGVFATVIPDNLKAIVTDADPLAPRLNEAFVEYAQTRGFHVDPARVRRPQDKPRVERAVQFVRGSMWAGETFIDLADAQRHAEQWCRVRRRAARAWHDPMPTHRVVHARGAATAIAGTDRPLRPADLHDGEGASGSSHRSRQGPLLGSRQPDRQPCRRACRSAAGADLLRWSAGQAHPRQQPGRRVTDPNDLPDGTAVYALRDIDHLRRLAASHGPAVGDYAAALLDIPLPWTKMRQVYALLGLVKKWGPERVNAACARALEVDAVNVALIGRILERGTEHTTIQPALPGTVVAGRFARDPDHFAVRAGGER